MLLDETCRLHTDDVIEAQNIRLTWSLLYQGRCLHPYQEADEISHEPAIQLDKKTEYAVVSCR